MRSILVKHMKHLTIIIQVAYSSCESTSERRNALVQFLGTDSDHRFGVSSSQKKIDADSGESEAQRQKRSEYKLVHLGDLIGDEKLVWGTAAISARLTQPKTKKTTEER
jgi:hypothetical protein